MKPLSEKALEEEILAILRYPNGKRPPRNSIAEEIRHEQADKLVNLILQDRKAWGEQVIGEDERIDIQSEFDKIDVPHLETDKYPGLDGVRQASRNLLRAVQRQRNQGAKTDE